MAHNSIAVADALMAELNGHTFDPPFTSVRKYMPRFVLPDLVNLRVSIVPKALANELVSRSVSHDTVQVDVAVQKKLSQTATEADNTEVDALMTLVADIMAFIEVTALTDVPRATWISSANEPIYDRSHMDEKNVFTSLITVTYKVV